MITNTYPELYFLAQSRYSCRSYADKPVADDTLRAILDVARHAPSAVNFQPVLFAVADSPEKRQAVLGCYSREWLATAPVIVVACADRSASWHRSFDGKDHADIDVAIAVDHLTLAAASLGVGSCWICNFDPDKLRAALGLGDGIDPVAIIPLGYPADEPSPRHYERKTLDQLVRKL